jgi:serine/threonine protein kinase
MSIDIVRGELERLFSLEEMTAIAADYLGLDAEVVGGSASKASFARALVAKCAQTDSIAALADVIVASRPEAADAKVRDAARAHGGLDELRPGATFGPFVIVRKLGEGPRGAVYAARQGDADRTVKIFRPDVTRDDSATARFLASVRIASKVKNEGLPSGLEAGTVDGRVWVASATIEGQPLATRVARTGPLHLNEAKPILRGVLGALRALHDARISHGAIRLENILVARASDGGARPILVDLGGDRLTSTADGPGSMRNAAIAKTASPERIRGGNADFASDIYAFGVVVFELLTGKAPFAGSVGADILAAHLREVPPVPSTVAPRGWVAKEADDAIAKLLAKDPAQRPKNATTVLGLIDPIGKAPASGPASIAPSAEQIDGFVDALVGDPTNAESAIALEAAVEAGADPSKSPTRSSSPPTASSSPKKRETPSATRRTPRSRCSSGPPASGRTPRSSPRRPRRRTRRSSRSIRATTSPPWRSKICAAHSASTRSSSRCCSSAARRARATPSEAARSTRSATSTSVSWTTASRAPSRSRRPSLRTCCPTSSPPTSSAPRAPT